MMDATGAAVRFDRIDVLGSVREGEIAHVVTRIHVGADALSIRKMNVISAKPWMGGWKLMLTGEMQGLQQMLQMMAAKQE